MKKNLTTEDYISLLVIVVGFLLLHEIFRIKEFYLISISVGVLSLIWSGFAKIILWLWEKISLILGWINTKIILGLFFYIFLTPIALVTRIFSKNLLQLSRSDKSYYITRNHKYKPEDIEKTW